MRNEFFENILRKSVKTYQESVRMIFENSNLYSGLHQVSSKFQFGQSAHADGPFYWEVNFLSAQNRKLTSLPVNDRGTKFSWGREPGHSNIFINLVI